MTSCAESEAPKEKIEGQEDGFWFLGILPFSQLYFPFPLSLILDPLIDANFPWEIVTSSAVLDHQALSNSKTLGFDLFSKLTLAARDTNSIICVQYRRGCSVPRQDILSTMGDVQYHRRYSDTCGETSSVPWEMFSSPHSSCSVHGKISFIHIWGMFSTPALIMICPHGTQDTTTRPSRYPHTHIHTYIHIHTLMNTNYTGRKCMSENPALGSNFFALQNLSIAQFYPCLQLNRCVALQKKLLRVLSAKLSSWSVTSAFSIRRERNKW